MKKSSKKLEPVNLKFSKKLASKEKEQIIETLKKRFESNTALHPDIQWLKVQERLESNQDKLWSLHAMEQTGGEPDVVAYDNESGEYLFFDCAIQSPVGRRSICYDPEAQASREKKSVFPAGSALGIADAMGTEILSFEQYQQLQGLGEFDTKTSSWIKTPPKIRKLGGAFFGDRRYDHVFLYHNGANSFYGARGFRSSFKL